MVLWAICSLLHAWPYRSPWLYRVYRSWPRILTFCKWAEINFGFTDIPPARPHLQTSAIHPLLHMRAHRRPQSGSVISTDKRKSKCVYPYPVVLKSALFKGRKEKKNAPTLHAGFVSMTTISWQHITTNCYMTGCLKSSHHMIGCLKINHRTIVSSF